jgi:hypothetical protein
MVRLSKIGKGKDLSDSKSQDASSFLGSNVNLSNYSELLSVHSSQNEEKYFELEKYLKDKQIPELLNVTVK